MRLNLPDEYNAIKTGGSNPSPFIPPKMLIFVLQFQAFVLSAVSTTFLALLLVVEFISIVMQPLKKNQILSAPAL